MGNRRARLRSKAVYYAYRGLGEGIPRVPLPVSKALTAVIVEAMARRPGGPAEMMARNLTRVLASAAPGAVPDEAVVRQLTLRSFRAYGRYWIEGARLPALPDGQVEAQMRIERGWEAFQAAMESGRGVVLALPHVGSWEWGGRWLAIKGYPMTTVAERLEPPELFDWFVKKRAEMGLSIVPLDGDSGGTVLRTLRQGKLVGLLCDRDIVGNGVAVDFFGERTTLPGGPATLALRTGAVLMSAVVYSGPGPSHTAVIGAPLDSTRQGSLRKDVARLTQQIAGEFEGYIRRAPEQWHMFQPNWPSDMPAVG